MTNISSGYEISARLVMEVERQEDYTHAAVEAGCLTTQKTCHVVGNRTVSQRVGGL